MFAALRRVRPALLGAALVALRPFAAANRPGPAAQASFAQGCSNDVTLFCRGVSINVTALRNEVLPAGYAGEIASVPALAGRAAAAGAVIRNADFFDSYRTGEAYLISNGTDNLPSEDAPVIIALDQGAFKGNGGFAPVGDDAVFLRKRYGPTLARSAAVEYVVCGAGSVRFDVLGLHPAAASSSSSSPDEAPANLTVLATYVHVDQEPYYCGANRARALAWAEHKTAHVHPGIPREPLPGRTGLWWRGVYGVRITYVPNEDNRRYCDGAAGNKSTTHELNTSSESRYMSASESVLHVCGAALGVISVDFFLLKTTL